MTAIGESREPELRVPSIDVFITFRCGLRCSHCFVGDNLNSHRDMNFQALRNLLRKAHDWGTQRVTFLGGEPTMYPRFDEALDAAASEGYETRIVTNGHLSYQRFIRASQRTDPFVCFSIDGSSEAIHDGIRGTGSFGVLLDSIALTRAAGLRTGAIVAICRENHQDIDGILDLCNRVNVEYVNVHYVTNRGFANRASVLGIGEWGNAYEAAKRAAKRGRAVIRVERTFLDAPPLGFKCAVKERSNLMFLPDGRVYMCMMFIDVPESHAFVWDGTQLLENLSVKREVELVSAGRGAGCPAMVLVNPDIDAAAQKAGHCVQCIYEKDSLGGQRSDTLASP